VRTPSKDVFASVPSPQQFPLSCSKSNAPTCKKQNPLKALGYKEDFYFQMGLENHKYHFEEMKNVYI
jgi:hypothetical protein